MYPTRTRKAHLWAFLFVLLLIVFWPTDKYKCAGAMAVRTALLIKTLESNMVDVTSLGATGDGATNDTKVVIFLFASFCNCLYDCHLTFQQGIRHNLHSSRSAISCWSHYFLRTLPIKHRVDGSIIAPVNPHAWPSNLLEWINFSKLDGITIVGDGAIDGQGAAWWKLSDYDDEGNSKGGSNLLSVRPTALRFYGSYDVSVQGITIQNSPQCHLKFDSCTSVKVSGVTISSPANSPNTDGIHLQNSRDVEIYNSSMACGDDCVSIQKGCSGIRVHNINCGPGHGISIGGLGKDGTKACVSNVSVYDSNVQDASNGVRIKTWQGGVGSLKSVSFSNIQVSNVRVPINIDQFYCDKQKCANRTSAVFITEVTYEKITGTYEDTPLRLACSDDVPCTDLKLDNIQLEPAVTHAKDPLCSNCYGQQLQLPDVDCLQSGRPANDPSRTQSPADAC